ncbi:MAG: LamG domain-containing protein [Planctomycetes bacterium]|nr:LamG domain-containing protein [Planctomycetota bacterium]
MTPRWLALGAITAVVAVADQDPGIVLREWRIQGEKYPLATFVRLDGPAAVLRLEDGSERKVDLWALEGRELAYLQRQRCVFPKASAIETKQGKHLLVDLSADGLADGPLKRWANRGALGGAFHPLIAPPVVKDVAGRKAVGFDYGPAIVAMELNTMVADFLAPACLRGESPFTIAAWLYNPGVPDEAETILSWHSLGGDDGADIRFGRRGRHSFIQGAYVGPMGTMGFPNDSLSEPNAWHHVAHVFTGGRGGEMRLYLDGRLVASKVFERLIRILPATDITSGRAQLNGDLLLHEPGQVRVKFFLGQRDGHYWTNIYPKEKDRWNLLKEVTAKASGPVSAIVDGLKPDTEYVWRIQVFADDEHVYWADGPGRFRTAAAEGAAGQAIPRDEQRYLFLGSSWGSHWDWVTTPRYFYTGAIAALQVYNHALDDAAIRRLCGSSLVVPPSGGPSTPEVRPAVPIPADGFEPEGDGPVVEPYPKGVRQAGGVTKYLDGAGHPIIAADDTPDVAMLRARHTCLKVLEKRPDLLYQLAVSNTAGSLEHEKKLGWTELVRNTYGATRNMLLDPNFYGGANMLMHERGHQLHMNGMSNLDLDFDHRLYETWLAGMRSLKYLGSYASNNMWEYIACAANAWINDGHPDDEVYPRDRLRQTDPRLYFLLNEYWSGDRRIELNATDGVITDPDGSVREWRNLGGVEFWGKQGWSKYKGTVGAFTPIGKPTLATVRGVSAVQFSGNDALAWSCLTRPEMGGNHEWSVELWVCATVGLPDRGAPEDTAGRASRGTEEVLVSWGAEASGSRLRWGHAGNGPWRAAPAPGRWHHLAFVFTGGGLEDGPGNCLVYINGKLDHQARHKLNLPSGAPVAVGGEVRDGGGTGIQPVMNGFRGAIAHVRVYDYDMHPLQVADHYEKERSHYAREELAVAGRLLVDLDPQRPETCPIYDHRPLYPASLSRPWARSWANRGTLGGKVANNVWRQSGSTPMPCSPEHLSAIRFQGKECMVSGFPLEAFGTIEAWVLVDRPTGTILEAADCRVPASLVPPGGWHHLAVVKDAKSVAVFLDGRKSDKGVLPADCRRLRLGAHWDGRVWTDHFHGAVAQVRIHSGALTKEQVSKNHVAGKPIGVVPAGPWAGDAPVIDLTADDLRDGRVEKWANRGLAGGAFVPGKLGLTLAPMVRAVEGRKGAEFMGDKYLRSTFAAPIGDKPFTLAVRMYDPRLWQHNVGVLVSIGARPKRTLEFGLDHGDRSGAFRCPGVAECGFGRPAVYARTWHDIVWTYAGRAARTFRIYVDGKLATERAFELEAAPADARLALGSASSPGGRLDQFRGLIGSVHLYEYALAEGEIGHLSTGRGAKPDDGKLLVCLDADKLPEGKVAEWPNAGTLGGHFGLDPEPERRPTAGLVAGRRGVTFDGIGTFLTSTIPTPPSLTGDRPFTIEAWVHNPSLQTVETVFSLAPEAAKKTFMDWHGNGAVECGYGDGRYNAPSAFANGTDGFNIAWEQPPKPGEWHHLAWVYSGGLHGTVAVYADGELVHTEEHVSLNTYGGFPMHLGAAWNTEKGPRRMLSGSLHRLTVHAHARSAAEIRATALRESPME